MGTVFISYSHDSQAHKDRVLGLAKRLRADGVDCIIDSYIQSPPEGWPKWMDRQLKDAQYVLIICTATYWRRVMDEEAPGKGKGVKWESTLTYQYIYDTDAKNTRFIPVLFDPADCQHIPTILKGVTVYYENTPEKYEELLRRLTNQPKYIKPDLGPAKILPPKEVNMALPPATDQPCPTVSTYKLPTSGAHLFGREKELKQLDDAWVDPHTAIVTLVAWGGVGKTALVNHWLAHMKEDGYRGAEKVYGWSFYSQGAAADKQGSADEFFQETLQWFGAAPSVSLNPVDKGRTLLRLLRQHKTLLILDGLEPLQYAPGTVPGMDGRLKDAGLAVFLKEWASAGPGAEGLCVISTREGVADLLHLREHGVCEIPLEHLGEEAGVQVLHSQGATVGAPADFRKAVTEYHGHALALTLLGHYIKSVFAGDIRRRDKIPRLTDDRDRGVHAKWVMAAYDKWLGQTAQRDILSLLGLFDRPVEPGAMATLLAAPSIAGVTERLCGIGEEEWLWALAALREVHLLAAENSREGGRLDAHPLVREYFGDQLRTQNPAGWQAAHQRLYHYYKNLPEKELPDTLVEMEPLFAAVAHGCKAGLHQEAEIEVYWKRISRGDEGYVFNKLGAFGSYLAALAHFFARPWSQPVAGLPEHEKAVVLSWAAFGLRAVGRLQEAILPMKAGLEMQAKQNDWENAAIAASNLSELHLTLGDVPAAVAAARQSVLFADRSEDKFLQEYARTTLADALQQSGAKTEAETWFREAEAKLKIRRPEYSFLYSVQGYQFCDLLLENPTPAAVKEVRARAEQALAIAKRYGRLLDIALDHLTLGRVALSGHKKPQLAEGKILLDLAVAGLRESGYQSYLPRGLLARAECFRLLQNYALAHENLKEARDIAQLGGMKLHLCDYYLEMARLCLAEGKEKAAAENQEKAEKLIEETGYGRRKKKKTTDYTDLND